VSSTVVGHRARQLVHRLARLVRGGEVLLEGRLAAVPARHPRAVVHRARPETLTELVVPDAHAGSELRDEGLDRRRGQLLDGADPEPGQPARHLRAHAPQLDRRAVTHDVEPVVRGESEDAGGLAELRGDLRAHLVVADADRAVQPRLSQHGPLRLPGKRFGVVRLGSEEGLVPADDLDDGPERAKGGHDLLRRSLVLCGVDRQEHGVGQLASGDP